MYNTASKLFQAQTTLRVCFYSQLRNIQTPSINTEKYLFKTNLRQGKYIFSSQAKPPTLMPEASSLYLSKLAGSFTSFGDKKKEARGFSFLVIGPKRKTTSTGSLCGCPLNYTSTLFKSTLISYIKGTCSTQRELIKSDISKANVVR